MSIRSIAFVLWVCSLGSLSAQTYQLQSSIAFPFRLTFQKLEESVNQALKGVVYLDTLHTDNDNDQLKCTVVKSGLITIKPLQKNTLRIDVPLKVWAEKGIGTLGVYAYQATNFELILSFQMSYQVMSDWRLVTKTTSLGYQWREKPSLNFVHLQVPITPIVENILNKRLSSYARQIDEQLLKTMDIKREVIYLWNAMKQPQLVSETYQTWLRMTPLFIEATPFSQDSTAIFSQFHIGVFSESFVGMMPASTPDVTSIPNLSYRKECRDDFECYIFVTVPYIHLTALSQSRFRGQEFEFQDGTYRVNLTEIRISQLDRQMRIEAFLSGSWNGKVILQGIPYYVDSLKMVKMKDLDFDMETKNLFWKTANWLFHSKIEQRVQEHFAIPVGTLLDSSQRAIHQSLNQVKSGVTFSGAVYELQPMTIDIRDDNLTLVMRCKGRLRVDY